MELRLSPDDPKKVNRLLIGHIPNAEFLSLCIRKFMSGDEKLLVLYMSWHETHGHTETGNRDRLVPDIYGWRVSHPRIRRGQSCSQHTCSLQGKESVMERMRNRSWTA